MAIWKSMIDDLNWCKNKCTACICEILEKNKKLGGKKRKNSKVSDPKIERKEKENVENLWFFLGIDNTSNIFQMKQALSKYKLNKYKISTFEKKECSRKIVNDLRKLNKQKTKME